MDFAVDERWFAMNPDWASGAEVRYDPIEKFATLLEEKYGIKIPEDRGILTVDNGASARAIFSKNTRKDRPLLYIKVDFAECGIHEEKHAEAVAFLKEHGYNVFEEEEKADS